MCRSLCAPFRCRCSARARSCAGGRACRRARSCSWRADFGVFAILALGLSICAGWCAVGRTCSCSRYAWLCAHLWDPPTHEHASTRGLTGSCKCAQANIGWYTPLVLAFACACIALHSQKEVSTGLHMHSRARAYTHIHLRSHAHTAPEVAKLDNLPCKEEHRRAGQQVSSDCLARQAMCLTWQVCNRRETGMTRGQMTP